MFSYKIYTQRERTEHSGLGHGYLEATGSPIFAQFHVRNLIDELTKIPAGEVISIVWNNPEFYEKTQEAWNFYTENITPHHLKFGRNIECDRRTFDKMMQDIEIEYPKDNMCDIFDLVTNYLNPDDRQIIVKLLKNKRVIVYLESQESTVDFTSYNTKSARNM